MNIRYDSTNKRYYRSRECFYVDEWGGKYPDDTIDMCCWPGLQVIPGYDLSQEKTQFLQSKLQKIK